MQPGHAIGHRYLLREPIGRGGMSVVWRAEDQILGREVAVKVLAAEVAADPASLNRLYAEARAAARLRHDNVVEVYDYGETAIHGTPMPYVVMELVEGRPLSALLSGGALPWRLSVLIGAQVAAALAAAHDHGVVHRDVKPANVMVAAGGVKLVDFGISAAVGDQDAVADEIIGTPAYLAPERLINGTVRPATADDMTGADRPPADNDTEPLTPTLAPRAPLSLPGRVLAWTARYRAAAATAAFVGGVTVTVLGWPSHAEPASTPAAAATSLTCHVAYTTSLVSPGRSTTTVAVTNTSPRPAGPWTLTFRLPGSQRLVRGADVSWRQNGETIEATGKVIPAGATTSTWFEARYGDAALLPQAFSLNNVACRSELFVQGPPATPVITGPAKKSKPAVVTRVAATGAPHDPVPQAKGPAPAPAGKTPAPPPKPHGPAR